MGESVGLQMASAFNGKNTMVVPQKKISSIQKRVEEAYNDLDDTDKKLIADYLEAFSSLSPSSKEYNYRRNRLIRKICEYYARYERLPIGSMERMKLIVMLQDFSPITRIYDINISDLRSISGNPNIGKIKEKAKYSSGKKPMNLNAIMNRPVEINTGELPEEIKTILVRTGWWNYVRQNIDTVFFMPRLKDTVKSLRADYAGTSGELTRCALVDSFSEKNNMNRELWDLASTLVVESAHVELFYKYNGNRTILGYNFNESYGLTKNCAFLKDLLALPETAADMNKKAGIEAMIKENRRIILKLTEN